MKVKSVNPGVVFQRDGQWFYTVVFDRVTHAFTSSVNTASGAKQEMREKVYFLRKKHGLLFSPIR
jgi:hypothetical protein